MMIISPDSGAALLVLSLNDFGSVKEGADRSSSPFFMLKFLITIAPSLDHLGVEWGQSVIETHSSSNEAVFPEKLLKYDEAVWLLLIFQPRQLLLYFSLQLMGLPK